MNKILALVSLFLLLTSCANNTPIVANPKYDNLVAYGIDISKHQDKVINDLNANDALTFVICKATEGKDYTDPYFSFNWKHIKRRGLVRGAYHFYHDDDDPIIQAKFFLKHLKTLNSHDLAPIVDIEEGSISKNKNITEIQKNLLLNLQYIENETGRKPMIYTGLNFANRFLNKKIFAQYPLWIAEYNSAVKPSLPKTWQKVGHKFWQKSESYTVESRISDFDNFNGTRKQLLNELAIPIN